MNMTRLKAPLFAALVVIFSGHSLKADQNSPKLDQLFALLQTTESPHEAQQVEAMIWRIWTRQGDPVVDASVAQGIDAMRVGRYPQAVRFFSDAIRLAPDYAEAWNKRATVFYLMNRYQESVRDIEKTLDLEPRHFGALSGLGLIFRELGDQRGALAAYERVLEVHPLMRGVQETADQLRIQIEGKKT